MKIVALLIAAVIAAPAAAVTFDPHLDFSTGSNPNGAYSYGYETSLGGPLTLFTTGGAANGNGSTWTSPAVDQYLGVYNLSTSILQHPGSNGQYSVVRLTLATAGSYLVSGSFSNGDNATSTVHVLTGGDVAFNGAINGAGSTSAFSIRQFFAAGTTIDFAVGNGGNGYNNDSTLLGATVTAVPEPATWSLLIGGFTMVGFAARRRRSALTA